MKESERRQIVESYGVLDDTPRGKMCLADLVVSANAMSEKTAAAFMLKVLMVVEERRKQMGRKRQERAETQDEAET
jgi:TPP-dependent indolepyruvate ferredoxin oxidoreductase alpha subunit